MLATAAMPSISFDISGAADIGYGAFLSMDAPRGPLPLPEERGLPPKRWAVKVNSGVRVLISKGAGLLRRSTTSGKFLPEIDGLRFFSIALVILYHTPYYRLPGAPHLFGIVGVHGNFGVQMFFVISGFILGLPFAETHLFGTRKLGLRRYFVRRLTRLEPPYLINLSIWFAIKVLVLGRSFAWLWPHLLASATYTHNALYGRPSEVNFYAWSLEVEVQFYILAPLLALVFRLPRIVRLIALALAILLCSLVSPGLSLASQGQWFLAGFVLTDIYLLSWGAVPETCRAFDALALAAWPLTFLLLGMPALVPNAAVASRVALPWSLLAAFTTAFRGTATRRALRWRPIYLIGGMCYSIYLYHGYVLDLAVWVHTHYLLTGVYYLDALVGLSLSGSAILGVCSCMFVLFEKPFMNPRWHEEFVRRLRGRVCVVTSSNA
jgi:peptidoglycan/LPS O-acetylase OafA/YrhL